MKKKTTLLFLLATLLLAIVPLEGFAYRTKLVGMAGNYSEIGGVYTINKTGGNNIVLSKVEANEFSFEAKMQVVEGDRMSLVFGHTGFGFYGVEIQAIGNDLNDKEVSIKGFRDGDDSGDLIARKKVAVTDKSKPIPFKIAVTAAGDLTVYVDGVEAHKTTINKYKSGLLGFLTWESKVVLTDVVLDLGGEEGDLVELENLQGDYYNPDPYYIIYNTERFIGGDNFVISDTEATAFTYEGKVDILSGDRMSLIFGSNGQWGNGGSLAVELLKKDGKVDVKGFKIGVADFFKKEGITANTDQAIPFKIVVAADGKMDIYVEGTKINDTTIQLEGYTGGRIGFLTWNSKVRFSDVALTVDGTKKELENLQGFFSAPMDAFIMNKKSGNNMVSSTTIATAFSYSGNVEILEGDRMSLVFGSAGTTGGKWSGAELMVTGANTVKVKAFQDNGDGLYFEKPNIAVDLSNPVQFKIDVTADKKLTVYVNGNKEGEATMNGYIGGRLGLLTWDSKAKLSDIRVIKKDAEGGDGNFKTNTTGWAMDPKTNGVWTVTTDGLFGIGSGNSPYFSASSAANFTFETDMKFLSTNTQAGGPVFRANDDHSVYYAVDINNTNETARVLKFYKNPSTGAISDVALGGETGNLKTLPNYVKKNNFKIRVEAIKSSIIVYIDDTLLLTASDGESLNGVFGVTNFSSEIVFQNMNYTEVAALPILSALTSDITLSPIFADDVFKYNAIVPFETTKIKITATAPASANLFIGDEALVSGKEKEITLKEGMNNIRVRVEDKTSKASTVTSLDIKRRYNPETAYTEKYRPQFHYTPEANWVNDPNGMVYYEGEYHLFYQYHPYSKQWGPMHWGHAISKDMVNWEEYPIALYPDKFGTIFSGSAVVDENNTTGFFTDLPEKKGIVAIYTNAGATQQQSIAYSKDKGRTWIKYNEGEPVIKTADDPMDHGDFRDPKVFWHEESSRWMMVIAGGPLRFYSSTNLIDWAFESGYRYTQTVDGKSIADIHTECPDFFKLKIEGSNDYKWVLVGSSKFYMLGDFKKVDGKWYFIPDTATRLDPNFGHDDYAGQTFSDTPDGRRIMMHWMTNFDYSGDLAKVTDPYNGAFTMAYELKLRNTSKGVRLYQTPVKEYEGLRKTPFSIKDKTIKKSDQNILSALKSKQYEIVAEITPQAGCTQFGFALRTGNGQQTRVYYTPSAQRLVIDRSTSGASPNDKLPNSYTQTVPLENGKLKLHIFVDWSTIEVFANDGEALATLLIFPDPTSEGMEFYTQGGDAKCTMDIYPLKSIWRKDTTDPWLNLSVDSPEAAALGVNVYTAGNELRVEVADGTADLKMDIFNIEGKTFFTQALTSGTTQLSLPSGFYVLKISGAEGEINTKVIMKE